MADLTKTANISRAHHVKLHKMQKMHKHIHQNKHKQKTNTNNLPHKVKAHHMKYGCEI